MIGIYAIKNEINRKVYIGQSKNLSHRRSTHLYDLKNNKHKNKEMQKDYNDNPTAFKFEILCLCDADELDQKEKEYIKIYKSTQSNNGYNLESGGLTNYDCADSTRKKHSEIKKGNKNMCGIKLSDEWKKHLSESQPHRKKVICIETSIIYESFADAARKTGLNRTKIVSCCTGKRKSTGGFHFKYYDEGTDDKAIGR